jgi:hypothetical protein
MALARLHARGGPNHGPGHHCVHGTVSGGVDLVLGLGLYERRRRIVVRGDRCRLLDDCLVICELVCECVSILETIVIRLAAKRTRRDGKGRSEHTRGSESYQREYNANALVLRAESAAVLFYRQVGGKGRRSRGSSEERRSADAAVRLHVVGERPGTGRRLVRRRRARRGSDDSGHGCPLSYMLWPGRVVLEGERRGEEGRRGEMQRDVQTMQGAQLRTGNGLGLRRE